MRLHAREDATLKLSKQGPGEVTAGDIELSHDVEVKNPNLVIATLTKDMPFEATIKVEKGRGYEPATARERPARPPTTARASAASGGITRLRIGVTGLLSMLSHQLRDATELEVA